MKMRTGMANGYDYNGYEERVLRTGIHTCILILRVEIKGFLETSTFVFVLINQFVI